ncbi:MAG TPA: hypothetical protein VGY99_28690 [Candidatus Binataceae bacterium]|nr:hypothetical protein [Candidatus Binataceae bacterium]
MFRVDSTPSAASKTPGLDARACPYAMESMTEPKMLVLNLPGALGGHR